MKGGVVTIECNGEHISLLLDQIVQAKVVLSHVKWVNNEKVRITVSLNDMMQVWKYMKLHKVNGRIVKKVGPFFWLKRMKKRKFFVIGFAIFLFLLFFFSSFIWYVDIEGNEQIPDKHILSILQKERIYPGQLKVGLPNSDELQRKLLKRIPNASWIGVRLEGTRIIVTIAEKKRVDSIGEKKLVRKPVNLIAKKNAFIMDVRVFHGNPVIKVHDAVKKGQLLVSGAYGDATTPSKGPIVGAQGIVLGEVWYQSEVVVPLQYVQNEYTGEKKRYTWPFVGQFVLANPFQTPKPYARSVLMRRISAINIGKYQFPLGFVRDDYWSVKQVSYTRNHPDAIALGKKRARLEMNNTIGPEGRILTEKVLHQRVDNGKVYLKIHFDVVENIAQEKPILQGD
ncbi:sporulation protein YqfD [Shimazuella kribbensis]|uniref:sporulation protein YqfD n=1 Tax=Shimazuella kribbensis TaxID=139808 RepID=UPI000426BF9E|nr:sporulation protein YqfD [Shimazuella kribbensis]